MKEIYLFCLASSIEKSIQELGGFGMLEVKEISISAVQVSQAIPKEIEKAQQAIDLLEHYAQQASVTEKKHSNNELEAKEIIRRVLLAQKLRSQIQDQVQELAEQLQWYHSWGTKLKLADFHYLQEKGIYLRLYVVEKKILPQLQHEHCIINLKEQNERVAVALFSRNATESLAAKEIALPNLELETIEAQIESIRPQLEKVDNYLRRAIHQKEILLDHLLLLEDLQKARSLKDGMENIEGKIKYLKGFLPVHQLESFYTLAKQNNWAYQVREPENPEEVPVALKNPKWVRMINPVMKFIDILPGYKEIDVSIYFLIAFALFFAMLVGDAGYGAIFLLITLLIYKKIPAQVRILIVVLSGATIVWGILTGTYFGSKSIVALPFLNQFVVEEIASFGVDNVSFMMHLSFLIGAIHLSIAHGIRFFQYLKSIKCLSELGWIALIWGLFFTTENLVLGKALPAYFIWLMGGGIVLVSFFSFGGKPHWKGILSSLSALPLSLINGFSDIVSYVRLFAVGLATAAVAASFNSIILPQEGLSQMGFLDMVLAALALVLGHTLNIALALMAVMVHGIRLNMLEFAGHLGIQFSGKAFTPFKLEAVHKKEQDEGIIDNN